MRKRALPTWQDSSCWFLYTGRKIENAFAKHNLQLETLDDLVALSFQQLRKIGAITKKTLPRVIAGLQECGIPKYRYRHLLLIQKQQRAA